MSLDSPTGAPLSLGHKKLASLWPSVSFLLSVHIFRLFVVLPAGNGSDECLSFCPGKLPGVSLS